MPSASSRLLFLFGRFVIYHALLFGLIESAESLVYVFDKRERIGIFFDYVFKIDKLRFIYKADYHLLILMRIAALTVQTSNSVVQFFKNFFFHILGMIGDYGKLIRLFGARYYSIAHKAADKTIQQAHTHGAIVVFHNSIRIGFAVYEIACDGDYRIDCKCNEKEVELRIFFAEELGNNIGSASRTVAFEQYSKAQSAYKTGNHNRVYRVAEYCSVIANCLVLEFFENGQMLEQQICKRESNAKRSRFAGKMLIHTEKRKYTQRHIDEKRHIAHAEMPEILYHYGDTVYSGRSKIVGNDEQHIAERIKTTQRKRKRIHPQFFFDEILKCHIS